MAIASRPFYMKIAHAYYASTVPRSATKLTSGNHAEGFALHIMSVIRLFCSIKEMLTIAAVYI